MAYGRVSWIEVDLSDPARVANVTPGSDWGTSTATRGSHYPRRGGPEIERGTEVNFGGRNVSGGRGEEREPRGAPHARPGAGWGRDDVISNGGLRRGGDVRGLEDLRSASCNQWRDSERRTWLAGDSVCCYSREVVLIRFLDESSMISRQSSLLKTAPRTHTPILPAKRFHWSSAIYDVDHAHSKITRRVE